MRLVRCAELHYGTFLGDVVSPFIGYYEFEQETGSEFVPLNCSTVQFDATTHSYN